MFSQFTQYLSKMDWQLVGGALLATAGLAVGALKLYARKARQSGLPATYRQAFLTKDLPSLEAKETADAFEVQEVKMPELRPGEVLVKVFCSPINPSDLSALAGTYNSDQVGELPRACGFEGAGLVVATGGGVLAKRVMGKRVAVASIGGGCMWSEYCVARGDLCVPLPDNISYEQGCSSFVNPLTALAFLDVLQKQKKGHTQSFLNTAGASALGKMLARLARSRGLNYLCTVRREAQKKLLVEEEKVPADNVFVTSDKNWRAELKERCAELKCYTAFDAVAGEHTGHVLKALPNGATVYVYGGLSKQASSAIHPTDLIFRGKTVTGLWLTSYLKHKSLLEKFKWTSEVSKLLGSDLGTEITRTYGLDEVGTAVSTYNANMTGGKVGIAPNSLDE